MSDLSLLTGIYANVEHIRVADRHRDRAHADEGDGSARGCTEERLGQLLVDAGDQGQTSRS